MRTLPAPTALALSFLAFAPLALAQGPSKKPVMSEADLPRHSYPVDRPASTLVQAEDTAFLPILASAKLNLADEFAQYDIKDRATLRDLLAQRVDQLELSHDYAGALEAVDALHEAQDKPSAKRTVGLSDRAIAKAALATGGTSGPAFEDAYVKAYAVQIDALPWDVVQDWARAAYASARLASPAVRVAYLMTELDPSAAKSHSLNDEEVATLVYTRASLKVRIPVAPLQARVLGDYIAAHATKKPDIWAAREVTLTADQVKAPVLVGIWDSGVDVSLFPDQTFTDPNPTASGVHGLALADDGEWSTTWLHPLKPEEVARYPEMRDDIVGRLDIEEGKESPQATQLEHKFKTDTAEQLHQLDEVEKVIGHYLHGTHCAGIAVRGNPGARLVVARFNDELPDMPFAPTEEWARKMGAGFQQMADYFRTRHVRVVNMSWSDDREEFELWLSKTGGGSDPAARKRKADQIYQLWRNAIEAAITSAPDTLFICAAGNADSNNGFTEAVPSSLLLPNKIAVGAVNQAGDETSFTSYGDAVVVDADGYDVESYVPGGARIKLSGTSMASPNVVNLAAKLFALDPSLTPAQVIDLIKRGSTASEDGRRHLIDEKQSVALLRAGK